MERAHDEMIERINEMFEKNEDFNPETKKQEIDDLKSLKEYLEKEFPKEESIKKGK